MKTLAIVLAAVSISLADGYLIVNLTGFESDSGNAVLALFTRDEWAFRRIPQTRGWSTAWR